jgi:hypothetical protein
MKVTYILSFTTKGTLKVTFDVSLQFLFKCSANVTAVKVVQLHIYKFTNMTAMSWGGSHKKVQKFYNKSKYNMTV